MAVTTESPELSSGGYDVAILGAGIAGGILAAVLARNGVRVLLLDAGAHPRFAVGESTIPYTSTISQIIAERYRVPEIATLTGFDEMRKVSPAIGQKRNFGFVYHEEGKPQDPEQINQEVIPANVEMHLFRQDVDAYFYHVALKYGAEGRLATRVTDIEIDPDSGVTLLSDAGERFHAAYLVDGSGFRSPVAQKLGLRDEPTRARHHCRSLFTHMVGVTPFDDATAAQKHTQPVPWHQGTLHHVFKGGWLWVIPFDNHESAVNPLCSVGLSLDERMYPKPDSPPEDEFGTFLQRFPEIAEQFRDARLARPWVSTDRLQYSASNTVGDRYCLTAHAAGFIDALYSRGLTNTMTVINSLAGRLIAAARADDWSTERFAYVDKLQQGLFDVHDDLVYSSYIGFGHYDLWNAVVRVWKATSFLSWVPTQKVLSDFRRSQDDTVFGSLESGATPGLPEPTGEDVQALLAFTRNTCRRVEAGELPAADAAAQLWARLRASDFLPEPLGLADPANRTPLNTPELKRSVRDWGLHKAPEHIRLAFQGDVF
ncbi:NAD(P)-binding protein [Streptomyces sp. SID10853]|uniref:NAD(P)/FAD-dependent oxidoreductase n=1 Tax=Streptomyces sp. SID10853 TaxID=2706028 RepID=UPI0013C15975|nr:tryptophan 7-halogenase [Streptomyces sp. SID10853]NDZ79371.1 NAD(P)-binding protein [Streptomyces sp. SID10853]